MAVFFSLLQDACLLGSLEDGLNALLNIEVRSIVFFYTAFFFLSGPDMIPQSFITFRCTP
jgi:hypothetical protein